MGRPRKPTILKKLQGTAQKCRLNKNEPDPKVVIPNPPIFLTGYAIEEWNEISVELERLGLISKLDKLQLAAYCQTYKRWRMAEEQLANEKMVIETDKGNEIQNPLIGIANTAMKLMSRFLVEFGMSPASRSRVNGNNNEKNNDPFDKFKKG